MDDVGKSTAGKLQQNCGGIIAVEVFAARAAPITVREHIADKQDCL